MICNDLLLLFVVASVASLVALAEKLVKSQAEIATLRADYGERVNIHDQSHALYHCSLALQQVGMVGVNDRFEILTMGEGLVIAAYGCRPEHVMELRGRIQHAAEMLTAADRG